MDDITQLLSGLERLEQKKLLVSKLSTHLSLLIDDALPNDMLPVGVPSDVAVEVRDELQAWVESLDGEKSALVKPTPVVQKKAPKKKPVPKKKAAKKITPKTKAHVTAVQ